MEAYLMACKKFYLTQCSSEMDETLDVDQAVRPEMLYTSARVQTFADKCRRKNVEWGIFSGGYGIMFPLEKKKPYYHRGTHPSKVTESEFRALLKDFDLKLEDYDEIWFYHDPKRWHPLFERLCNESSIRVRKFSDLTEI